MRKKLAVTVGVVVVSLLFVPMTSKAEIPNYRGVIDAGQLVVFNSFKNEESQGDKISGKLYRQNGKGPFPAIVALHGAGGIFPYQLWWARHLRDQGYVVLVVDSYCKRDFLCEHASDDTDPSRGEVMRSWQDVPIPQRVSDALGAFKYLLAQSYVDKNNLGLLGWSWGGSSALFALTFKERFKFFVNLKGAVAFYPNFKYMKESGRWPGYRIDEPVLIFYGKSDVLESPESYRDVVESGKPVNVIGYEGAVKKFDEVGESRTKYHPAVGEFEKSFKEEAFDDSKRRMDNFFRTVFGK